MSHPPSRPERTARSRYPLALLPLLALRLTGLGPAAAHSASAGPTSSPADAVAASNRFGFDVYERIKQDRGNVLFSPASASIVLAMMASGARGQTLSEMLHVLHVGQGQWPAIPASFAALLDALNDNSHRQGLVLHLAERVWGQRDFPFNQEFLERLRRDYGAPLGTADFGGATDEARATINRWAADQTHGRIKDVLAPGDLDSLTRLVLTNALYFKGRWVSPFRTQMTSPAPFAAPNASRMVATMKQVTAARYAKVDGVALVELAYRGGLSMLVILPDGRDGLNEVESQLGAGYERWRAALANQRVDLQLPRWRTATSLSLRDALATLGMPSAFTTTADFSGVVSERGLPLALKRVLQQAFIKVDETGTEAAAVTVGEIGLMGKPTAVPVVVHVDHPFLYVVADQHTGAVLFIGRVVDPAEG
jgi:serpin B